jgi:serine/threonine protein kinase/Tol biopolymer transport system component
VSLGAGTKLGPYEILSPLGAGGMGEVYKARDTRLERTVAIKVLPQRLSSSPEVRRRFEREAKTISQLSHPHICALYDVGREGETEYLVMEYLEGETLLDRLAKGPLPLEQTLRYGQQIADALDKAHRQGIVHRDLKPGNVMLTKSGVKLVDFGLAKAIQPEAPQGSLTSLPTRQGLTQEGTILGTFQYMAPEQLEGKDADARTDIFAFGAVLYEMATGKKAFSGTSQASLISAIMKEDPAPITAVSPLSPPALDHVARKCLAKDPEDRWQSAADLRSEIKWIAEGSQSGVAAPAVPRRRARFTPAGVMGAFALGAVLSGLAVYGWFSRRPSGEVTSPAWFSILLPSDAPLASYGSQRLAFSPDGSRLAYSAEQGGTTRLYLRSLGRLDATPIRDSEGATSAFFSPDSKWIAFAAGGKLMKVPVEGGVPQVICEATEVRGGSWAPDGTVVFATGTSGLRSVPASGGTAKTFLRPEAKRGETALQWPQILPGEKAVLFTTLAGSPRIEIVSLRTGRSHELTEGLGAYYSPSGHLVFVRGGSLFAAPFDLTRQELTGPAISILDGVMIVSPFQSPQFALSSTGALGYVPGSAPRHTLALVDREGKVSPLPFEPREWEEPRFSPDGNRIAATVRATNPDIWILDLLRGSSARLTFDPGEDETVAWAPDGKAVAFSANRKGQPSPRELGPERPGTTRGIYRQASDGSGAEERLLDADSHPHVSSWSPDGRTLAYTDFDPDYSGDIWILTLGQKAEKRPWLRTPFNERAGSFSPDGRWIVYVSNESGRDEIYVQPFPGPGGKWQVSVSGGTEPVWSRDGKELFYLSGRKMMSVPVSAGTTFSAEIPHVLFEGSFVPTRRGEAAYDVSPDGRRFLMVRRDEQMITNHLNVVLNFSQELTRRAPPGKQP